MCWHRHTTTADNSGRRQITVAANLVGSSGLASLSKLCLISSLASATSRRPLTTTNICPSLTVSNSGECGGRRRVAVCPWRSTVHATLSIHRATIQLRTARRTLIKPAAVAKHAGQEAGIVPPAIDFSFRRGPRAAVQLRQVRPPGRL